MKSRYTYFTLILTCILGLTFSSQVSASHIYGAEINYSCVDQSTNLYFVQLKLFSDCNALPMPSNGTVSFSSVNCASNFIESLPLLDTYESSPYCAADLANTDCNGGSLPGFEAGIFGKLVTLPGNCSDWIVSHTQCCRNGVVTNLVNPSFFSIYVKAELDASAICNSSPQWKQPAVLICGSGAATVELGATDPDGDSLVYSLSNPMGNSGTPLAYSAPYSVTNPLSSSTAITFDSQTGVLGFTPTISQAAVIAVKVDEYRNGNFIASSYRDIQITIATGASCTNAVNTPQLATGPFNVVGGTINGGVIEACAGTNLSFGTSIVASAPAGILTFESNAADFGAVFGSTFVGQSFSWTPTVSDTGIQVLTVVARGDCSLPGISAFSFVINVSNCTPSGTLDAGPDQTICLGSSATLQATGGTTYSWTPTTGLSDPTIPNPIASPTVTTMYYVTSSNGSDSVLITVVGNAMVDITVLSGSTNLCLDDTIVLDAGTTGAGFAGYIWSTGETNSVISLHTFNPSSFSNPVSVTVTDVDGCTSTDSIVLDLQDDCVWPGDANYDGIANNQDILNIGLGSGTNGPSRSGASLNWESQWAADWIDTFATGNNYKHGDCNGDGIIDNSDTAAVSQNYGLTHAKGNAANGNALVDPSLYFTFSEDSVNAGDTLTIFANLGRDTLPAVDIYGIAFTVNYDAALVDTGSVSTDFSNSWIDIPMDGLMSFTKKFENIGMIDIAITRTDQINANTNFGPIGAVSVVMKDDISGKNDISKAFGVYFSKVKAVSSDGTERSIFSEASEATVSQTAVGIFSPVSSIIQVNVFPNPSTGAFSLAVENDRLKDIAIYDLLGNLIYQVSNLDQTNITINHQFAEGVYIAQIRTNAGLTTRKITVME